MAAGTLLATGQPLVAVVVRQVVSWSSSEKTPAAASARQRDEVARRETQQLCF